MMPAFSMLSCAIFTSLLSLCVGCNASSKQQPELRAILEKSFEKIYLATNGLEYPSSLSMLNNCIKHNDEGCLKSYNEVLAGKKMIKSVPPVNALDATLDIIESACLSKDKNLANSICYGGILSLYFYDTPEQDSKILSRIKIYPKKIKSIIFGTDFFWFYNRPNKAVWINAISSMDINWRNDIHKQHTLDQFNKGIVEFKDRTFVMK